MRRSASLGKESGFLIAAALLSSASVRTARAEEPAAEAPPKAQVINAVERGAFLETSFGASFLVTKVNDRKFGLAPTIGLYAGYDVLPILNVAVGASLMAAAGSQDPAEPSPRGDLLFVTPALKVQFALLTTERNFLWVRGEAGFAFGSPKEIEVPTMGPQAFGGNGPAFGGGLGFERFTKLRHFSFGAHAGVFVVTKPSTGIAVSLVPTLKYTF